MALYDRATGSAPLARNRLRNWFRAGKPTLLSRADHEFNGQGVRWLLQVSPSRTGVRLAVLRGFREFRRKEPEERAGSAAAIDFQEGHAGL